MWRQFPISVIEGIINDNLAPFDCKCECHLMSDGSLAVNVHDTPSGKTSLTVVGIPPDQYRDENKVRRLASSIRDDLNAICHKPVPRDAQEGLLNGILGLTPHH